MSLSTIIILSVGLLNLSTAAPDSAGIVEMVKGLAYGGIPYGSVTGMVANYPGFTRQQFNYNQARQLNRFRNEVPLVVNPNFRATRLVDTQSESVQIYKDPGVLGSINYIEYYAPLVTKS
ncbi:hypothetical protein E2986_13897 [Frieseomelitta varia]|uniref:Uncharacterized protein n=1 Tax=Frieseomelitta varia TaxID=561572 RepID=A0A833SCE4_9HYME|nr:hypothetical protein E2986_13897 [Frieseomelitta varia]